jgi:hypothetical protein
MHMASSLGLGASQRLYICVRYGGMQLNTATTGAQQLEPTIRRCLPCMWTERFKIAVHRSASIHGVHSPVVRRLQRHHNSATETCSTAQIRSFEGRVKMYALAAVNHTGGAPLVFLLCVHVGRSKSTRTMSDLDSYRVFTPTGLIHPHNGALSYRPTC